MTTYETFLATARSTTVNDGGHAWGTPEAIAQRAYEQQSCIWHAVTSLRVEHMDELGYGTCPHCGGVTDPRQQLGHALCVVRAAQGRETPMLDSTPRCDCARCRPGLRFV